MRKAHKITAGLALAASLLTGSFATSTSADAQTPQLEEKPLLEGRSIVYTQSFYIRSDGTRNFTSGHRTYVLIDPTVVKTGVAPNNCTPARLLLVGC